MLNAFFRNKNQAGAFASPIILVFCRVRRQHAAAGADSRRACAGWREFTVNNWFITGCREIVDGRLPLAVVHGAGIGSGLLFAAVAMVALQRRFTT